MEKLVVFDLDGTIVVWSEGYREFYSGTLNQVVERERGELGLKVLQHCRENFDGKGELSLFILNIPFRKWAKELIDVPLNLISAQPMLVNQIRELDTKKVIYTGSPERMVSKVLTKIGFSEEDFDLVISWREPELFPVKWSCSPIMFEYVLERFQISSRETWSVGDDWEMDLRPAQIIGMKTAKVGKADGNPTLWVSSVQEFLSHIRRQEGGETSD